MKRIAIALAVTGLLSLGGAAVAEIGTVDDVPAATLLLPYFEVDMANPTGPNTLFSINNASATAVLAHVTVWSDQSVPVLDFDVYLTGYDVQTISLREIFTTGNVPVTASVGQDPKDTISPQGPISQDINFASCTAMPYPAGFIGPQFRAHLTSILQGGRGTAPGTTGLCYGSRQLDQVLRGYVTIDTVNACNVFFPSDFAQYSPFLTYQNVLWGDYFYVNGAENFAQGETLVHIEACTPGNGYNGYVGNGAGYCPFTPGEHTFYGRYNAMTGADQREPLATTFAVRYLNGGPFNGGTDLIVWREADETDSAYTCTGGQGGPPSWWPLESTQIVIFDEEELPVTAEDCASGDPFCEQEIVIPNEANRVDVATDLLAPFDFGWIWLNLQHTDTATGDPHAQAWVTTVMDATGRFSVGLDAVQLDNANDPNTTFLPVGSP